MTTIVQEGIKIVISKLGDATIVQVGPDTKSTKYLRVGEYGQQGKQLKIVMKP